MFIGRIYVCRRYSYCRIVEPEGLLTKRYVFAVQLYVSVSSFVAVRYPLSSVVLPRSCVVTTFVRVRLCVDTCVSYVLFNAMSVTYTLERSDTLCVLSTGSLNERSEFIRSFVSYVRYRFDTL